MSALAITIAVMLVVTADLALAKGGGGDEDRSEFYGLVEARPEKGLQGEWVIGGRTVKTDAGTEFDEAEGRLTVGSCAKVKMRGGRVHEIDSEPMTDCQ